MENTKADKSFSDKADFFYKRILSLEKKCIERKMNENVKWWQS